MTIHKSSLKKTALVWWHFCVVHKVEIILLLLLLACHIFLRFYQLAERANLGWDQADSAWAAKNIIVNHQLQLRGVPVKDNTGIYMAPLYYYLIAPVYSFTRLDPIASPIFAGITSIFNFFVLFFVTKKLFGTKIALIALFINTFSLSIMQFDRSQNGMSFIVPVSYLMFYCLYNVITGHPKYILWLAVVLGFSFSVDFTSVFYPLLIVFALPFFPRTKQTLYYSLLALPILFLFIFPIILVDLGTKHATSTSFLSLFQNSYHGIHLRRVIQLTHDAFIGFLAIFNFTKLLDYFDFLIPPLFAGVYYFSHPQRDRLLFSYLMVLWFLIPWIVLSTYNGELTNSYFSLPQDIAIAMLAYLTLIVYQQRYIILKATPIIFWAVFAMLNLQQFFKPAPGNFLSIEETVQTAIHNNQVIQFNDKDPYSYIYYVYTKQLKKPN